MLLNEPDLLLLDEPTNHLDLETTKWLEDYLKYFKGAIVIISHDRYFLDKIVTQIYDVALGDVKRYVGNYEQFIEQRDKYYESRMQEYERQQDEIKRLETFVEKNITRASTSGMAKSRRKTLEKWNVLTNLCWTQEVLTFNLALIVIQVMTLCIYVI